MMEGNDMMSRNIEIVAHGPEHYTRGAEPCLHAYRTHVWEVDGQRYSQVREVFLPLSVVKVSPDASGSRKSIALFGRLPLASVLRFYDAHELAEDERADLVQLHADAAERCRRVDGLAGDMASHDAGEVASRSSSSTNDLDTWDKGEAVAHTASGHHGFADDTPDDTPIDEPPMPASMDDHRQLAIVAAWRAGARTYRALRDAMDEIDAAAAAGAASRDDQDDDGDPVDDPSSSASHDEQRAELAPAGSRPMSSKKKKGRRR